ncbi:MAG: hydrogenase iron-sulfur subunit [Syntrophobacteraceae bacterium]|jgi:F420-non-reducing hydrogenase iron-sulfur subunit|nr:hydrogenase iron-sulfur subunit [Syntrophobacteraceae bacterium]
MTFEPKILAFTCNWCAYAAADLAGTARMQYPTNIRVVRVMCSGMVHPNLVMEAFQHGADGVLVMGCHPGECHYQDGNVKARARMIVVDQMIESLGLAPERFRLFWCSSAEADRFVSAVSEMTDRVRRLGPSPYHQGVGLSGETKEDLECASR